MRFIPRRIRNNKGFFNFGGSYERGKTTETIDPYAFRQNPDYAESEGARKLWWEKLQDFGGEPGYGAISPDWNDVWQSAQQKIRDYYSGTATQPGAISKIRASAARRGASDSPAVETEITKALVEQGGQMGDLATQQSLAQSQFSEAGRLNWLQNIMGLSQMNPMGIWHPTGGETLTSQFGVSAKAGLPPAKT